MELVGGLVFLACGLWPLVVVIRGNRASVKRLANRVKGSVVSPTLMIARRGPVEVAIAVRSSFEEGQTDLYLYAELPAPCPEFRLNAEDGSQVSSPVNIGKLGRRWAITGADPGIAKVWTALAIEQLKKLDRVCRSARFTLRAEDNTILATVRDWDRGEVLLLAQVIDLVAALASADLYGLRALHSMPGATYKKSPFPWKKQLPTASIRVPQEVLLQPVIEHGKAVTAAVVSENRRETPLLVKITPKGVLAKGVADDLSPETRQQLCSLPHGTFGWSRSGARFQWNEIVTDHEELRSVARFLGTLGVEYQGASVYR